MPLQLFKDLQKAKGKINLVKPNQTNANIGTKVGNTDSCHQLELLKTYWQ